MSCNGCRVLRKGCSENCILRPCIQWIESPEAQGHATVFVAKFFGRAGLMSFISAVPEPQCPALFQSLLYEACGRTVNPVNGAVGLLWTGNWNICQAAVETVLRGGSLKPIPELLNGGGAGFAGFPSPTSDEASEICTEMLNLRKDDSGDRNIYHHCRFSSSRTRSTASPPKRRRLTSEQPSSELDLSLIPSFPIKTAPFKEDTPSMYSEDSVTTVSFRDNNAGDRYVRGGGETAKLLNLFA
ncbi:PREDICTED: LOB domain-containing protein 38 [Camelina sativa]|uniref:LOB domain-containing protein 38 n=1 Tax=Camelina sativa TaxID=90675 RepID=A0ABM0YNL2_CAMSA|nr:PREDICTED: LOB domain-containing protein 38 [Camelina sativa]